MANQLQLLLLLKHKCVIMAGTNARVDMWNARVQQLNINQLVELHSANELCQVDDPKDVLKNMLSDEVLNSFTDNTVPPHVLRLKVGDICYLYRCLSRKEKLATNTRVRILQIQTFRLRTQTLGDHPPVSHSIPRIKFKFKLLYGSAYEMIRTQFPLRFAYAFSDIRDQRFSICSTAQNSDIQSHQTAHLRRKCNDWKRTNAQQCSLPSIIDPTCILFNHKCKF